MNWKIIDKVAYFDHPAWTGEFHLSHPDRGLIVKSHKTQVNEVGRDNRASCIGPKITIPGNPHAFTLGEYYARETDLIIHYPADEHRDFNIQLDVRLVRKQQELIGMEFWLSIQTHLLDTHPIVATEFEFEMIEDQTILYDTNGSLTDIEEPAPGPQIARAGLIVNGGQSRNHLSCVILLHPLDHRDVRWSNQGTEPSCHLEWFGQPMEKGVIRRGRMQYLIAAEPLSVADVQTLYDEFAESPLPLTV